MTTVATLTVNSPTVALSVGADSASLTVATNPITLTINGAGLQPSNNLSELTNTATALANLGAQPRVDTGSAAALTQSWGVTGETGQRGRIHNDGTLELLQRGLDYPLSHSTGSVGSGSDAMLVVERTVDRAHSLLLAEPRVFVTDGGSNRTWLTATPVFPMTGTGTFSVKDASAWATSGTGNFEGAVGGRNQATTFTWTGKTSTSLTGVTCAPSQSSDLTSRHPIWVVDSFGSPILGLANFGGGFITDELWMTNGILSASQRQVGFAYQVAANRGTGMLVFGGDDAAGSTGDPYKGLRIWRSGTLTLSSTGRLLLPDGTAGSPSYSFTTDPTTGLFYAKDGFGFSQLHFSVGGTDRWLINNNGAFYPQAATYDVGTSTNPVRTVYAGTAALGAGTGALPAIYGNGMTGTGLSWDASLGLVFSANGTAYARLGTAGNFQPYTDATSNLGSTTNRWVNGYFSGVMALAAGTNTAPAIYGNGMTGYGLSWDAGLGLVFSAAGAGAVRIGPTGNLVSYTDATASLGSNTNRFKDLFMSGTATIGTAATVGGNSVLTSASTAGGDASGTLSALTITGLTTKVASARPNTTTNNSNAETTLIQQAVTGVAVGDRYRLRAAGRAVSNSGSASTYQFKWYIGSTLVMTSSAMSMPNSVNTSKWVMDWDIEEYTDLAHQAHIASIDLSAGGTLDVVSLQSTSAVGDKQSTVDWSSSQDLKLTCTMGTANTNVSITIDHWRLERTR